MHTILLTRIFQTFSDELQRFNLVQSHLGDFSSGITLASVSASLMNDRQRITKHR